MIKNKLVAKRYVKAFAHEHTYKEKISRLSDELKAIAKALESDDNLGEFFRSPITPRDVKLRVINNMAKQLDLSSYTRSLLGLLIRNRRMEYLPSVAEELQMLSDELNDRVRVTITTAYEPSAQELEDLSKRISKYFKRKVLAERQIDPSIIGGFILEGDEKVIDMSIKSQIERIFSKI